MTNLKAGDVLKCVDPHDWFTPCARYIVQSTSEGLVVADDDGDAWNYLKTVGDQILFGLDDEAKAAFIHMGVNING